MTTTLGEKDALATPQEIARDIVTQWICMFDPPPQINFQQSEFLQAAIVSALTLSRPDDGDGGSERNSTCNEGSNANEDSSTKSSGGAE